MATKTATKTATKAKIVPYGDRVVVKQIKQDEVRASGIVIPDTAKERPQLGEVLAVGPGRLDENGKRVPIEVKVGERVLFAKYSGQEVPRGILPGDQEEYLVLKEADILARLQS
ncbi:MAG: co-chaperone GroES [Chloroflexota bacterium]|nr:co-chaperone GroES [Chloroflexota bacterium]